MKRLFFTILAITTISFNAQALDCLGVNQWVQTSASGDQMMTDEVALNVMVDNSVTLRMSADLGDTHFFVQGNKKTGDYLMMVTLGPDYTRGVTGYAVWDESKGMRLTRVDGDLVYKIICK